MGPEGQAPGEGFAKRAGRMADVDDRIGDVWNLPERLGVAAEIVRVDEFIGEWIDSCEEEIQGMLRYQLTGPAKRFRPVLIFACQRAVTGAPASEDLIRVATACELFHNFTLIVDDILDRDQYRRGKLTLHCRFGFLPGLMVGGYFVAAGCQLVSNDHYLADLLTGLGRRIAIAECKQWRLRGQALGIDEWRQLAGEDTGAMFQVCAQAGTRDDRLARYGYLLGTLYHGCDDVADIRGSVALGAESDRDVTDRILTLPAAIATRDPYTAELFEQSGADVNDELTERLGEVLPEAEALLDEIAEEAAAEARANAAQPDGLLELVRLTRALSNA